MRASLIVPNFRDVGETVNTLLGKPLLSQRVLLRGGEIDFLDDLDLIFAPRTIINLRKGTDPEYAGASTFHCPAPDSVDVYSVEAGHNRKWILSVLKVLTDAVTRPPFYIHCAAGKDRTGVIIAAILMAIGVERKVVEQDYKLSLGPLQPELFADSLSQFEQADYFRRVAVESLHTQFLTVSD